MNASFYIEKLGLTKHVEGGAFKETYRSEQRIAKQHLPASFQGDRNYSTAIYFLLEYGQFSAFHRIASDELWHFYDGVTLHIYEIDLSGKLVVHKLGRDMENGESFQVCIKAGSWFGSRCEVVDGFALVGCTVAPGFDFADFELADSSTLSQLFPTHQKLITELTY